MTVETRKSDRHLSSFHVELLRLGAACPEERTWIERHLQACGRCAEMAVAFQSHRVELGRRPAAPVAATGEVLRAPAPKRRRLWALGLGVALPVAAAFVLVLSTRRPPESEPAIAAKGGASLTLVARRAGRVFPVEAGTRLRPGDQLRFVVTHVRLRYLLIASIDGEGHTSVYFPYAGAESGDIGPGERLELPGSIVIDASAGPERFFALFSAAPLQTTAVQRALDAVGRDGTVGIRHADRLDVGADEQASMLVEKEPR